MDNQKINLETLLKEAKLETKKVATEEVDRSHLRRLFSLMSASQINSYNKWHAKNKKALGL